MAGYFRVFMVLAVWISANQSILWAEGLDRFDTPSSWQQDAELSDVFFLNQNMGWAVGTQGTILRTTNGGQNWFLASTVPVFEDQELSLSQKLRGMQPIARAHELKAIRCRLESVHFVNPKLGWIVGGYEYPYMNRSRGVVLQTQDGGKTWHEIQGLVIPKLRKVHFRNAKVGWALGDTSNLYRSGILMTSDGGQSWTGLGNETFKDWVDGEQLSHGFVLVDRNGGAMKVVGEEGETSVKIGKTTFFNALTMTDSKQGIAVGDQGKIRQTDDGGLSWKPAMLEPLRGLDQVDLNSVASTAEKIWMVGTPGSRIYSIDKSNGQMESVRSPTYLPLNKIQFADDQHGWAVGALGTIIATNDGGKSWHRQHGMERVGLMTISESRDEISLEVMSKYANEENCVTANVILGDHVSLESLQQASERLGANTSVRVRQNNRSDSIEDLVRMIRLFRPNVIVATGGMKIESTLEIAVSKAADRVHYQQQINQLGLSNWQVDRVAIKDTQGNLSIDSRRFLPRVGEIIEDNIAVSRALLGLDVTSQQDALFRVAHLTTTAQSTRNDGLVSGLARAKKDMPVRKSRGQRGNLGVIQHAAQKQKTMTALSSWSIADPKQAIEWRKQVQSWVSFVNADTAPVWVIQLAGKYLEQGKTEQAAIAMEMIVNRWPDHAFGPAAMKWLIHYYSSSEFSNHTFDEFSKIQQFDLVKQAQTSDGQAFTHRDGNVTQTVWVPNALDQQFRKASQSGVTTALQPIHPVSEFETYQDARRQNASMLLSRLRQRDPDLVLSSEYLFIETRLTHQQNGWLPVANLAKRISLRNDQPDFAMAAKREMEIQDDSSNPSQWKAVIASARPFLDGQGKDACWASNRFRLTNPSEKVLFSYDDEFLYVFATLPKLKTGQSYVFDQKEESDEQDPDLSRRDRLEIKIDVDRDYCSAAHFVVDYRGWAAEYCGGSKDWNPEWFLAIDHGDQAWSVEMAIPWSALSRAKPTPGSVWAVSMQRLNYDSVSLWGDQAGQKLGSPLGFGASMTATPDQFQLLEFE